MLQDYSREDGEHESRRQIEATPAVHSNLPPVSPETGCKNSTHRQAHRGLRQNRIKDKTMTVKRFKESLHNERDIKILKGQELEHKERNRRLHKHKQKTSKGEVRCQFSHEKKIH